MYINTITREFPVTEAEIQAAMPYTSFTDPFEPPPGYATVEYDEQPVFDPLTHTLEQIEPKAVLGVYHIGWKVKALTGEEAEAKVTAKRELLKRTVTARRWAAETGGVTLPNGIMVKTEKADQDRIIATISGMEGAGIQSVDFKADSGWVTLGLAEIKMIRSVIALHVQACFSVERAHHEAIDALDSSELSSYDVTTGWPS